MYKLVIDMDKSSPAAQWPVMANRRTGDDELSQDEYRALLQRGDVPGRNYYKIALSHPQDYIGFKVAHKRTLGTSLVARDGKFYQIEPHLGAAGFMNLYVIYWYWERRNRPRPPVAAQVMSGMTGPSGAGLGGLWATSEHRHVIAVVASPQNNLIRAGCPVIKEWNGPITLEQLGCFVCEWYAAGSPGAKGKRPGVLDLATMPDLLGLAR